LNYHKTKTGKALPFSNFSGIQLKNGYYFGQFNCLVKHYNKTEEADL